MVREKANYKRFSLVGPGGRKCGCCYPAPGKARRDEERKWKKKERAYFTKLIEAELLNV